MSAKEMFEELGYELRSHKNIIRYVNKQYVSDWNYIDFNLKEKTIYAHIMSDSPFTPDSPLELNLKEIQAINKQIEELGWNE